MHSKGFLPANRRDAFGMELVNTREEETQFIERVLLIGEVVSYALRNSIANRSRRNLNDTNGWRDIYEKRDFKK